MKPVGRPLTHDTPEKAAEAIKKQKRESYHKVKAENPDEMKERIKNNNETQQVKINTDPEKKAKVRSQKKASKDKIKSNMTPEEEEAQREYNRIKKRESRARKKNPSKVNIIPSKTDFVNQFKENQLKIACEIAEEL